MTKIREQIACLCVELAQDRLLVQGAGGNISWKENELLWVKGSGTWLANANKEDIFVPVDLIKLKQAIESGNFEFKPEICNLNSQSKPSIETILHGLMPHAVVLHLHVIQVLRYLVLKDCELFINKFTDKFNELGINSCIVDYRKPGASLAREVLQAISLKPGTNVLFLKNHGIVIGAHNVSEIRSILMSILEVFEPVNHSSHFKFEVQALAPIPKSELYTYSYILDDAIQSMVFDDKFLRRIRSSWALYPDHIVFLGSKPFIFRSWEEFYDFKSHGNLLPELIFIENIGVLVKPTFNMAKMLQLKCYFDVVSKISVGDDQFNVLSDVNISELINWDAEEYRKNKNEE